MDLKSYKVNLLGERVCWGSGYSRSGHCWWVRWNARDTGSSWDSGDSGDGRESGGPGGCGETWEVRWSRDTDSICQTCREKIKVQ